MTVERENRWLKVIVVGMFLVGITGIIAQHHTRNTLFAAADQQTRLWQLRCGQQQYAADQSPLVAAAVWQPDVQARTQPLRGD